MVPTNLERMKVMSGHKQLVRLVAQAGICPLNRNIIDEGVMEVVSSMEVVRGVEVELYN